VRVYFPPRHSSTARRASAAGGEEDPVPRNNFIGGDSDGGGCDYEECDVRWRHTALAPTLAPLGGPAEPSTRGISKAEPDIRGMSLSLPNLKSFMSRSCAAVVLSLNKSTQVINLSL